MIASLVSFIHRLLWMSVGALVVNPAVVRVKRPQPVRKFRE